VTKAFIANDWKFYDEKGKVMDASCPTSMPIKVKATFQIQKIGKTGNWLLSIQRQAPGHMPSQSRAENSQTSQMAWTIRVRTLSGFLEPSQK
jgi:hypothetical protein